LLNASVGVQRVIGRLRRPQDHRPSSAIDLRTRSRAAAHQVQGGLHALLDASGLFPVHDKRSVDVPRVDVPRIGARKRSFIGRLGPDRAVGIAIAGILLGASVASVSAGRPAPNTGGPTGNGPGPRLVVGGAIGGLDAMAGIDGAQDAMAGIDGAQDGGDLAGSVQLGAPDPTRTPGSVFEAIDFGDDQVAGSEPVSVEGPFIDDGTLVKPVAVDTVVPDGSALVKTYTVKPGDTLARVAAKYGVSMMSVWWANHLKSRTDLHQGQVLRIPPVSGLIVKVSPTDTLDTLAARYDVNGGDILVTNGLDDPNLVVGQILVVPGAKGKAISETKPIAKPLARTTTSSRSIRPPATYTGGRLLWPVVGGGNYISQYYHYGHYGLDIAADYGSTVRAAAAGTVISAGWVSGGGGWAVWIAHGSGLYTTYNHLSAITVGVGEQVTRGQQVGRVGQSGHATGPHCHFEVWRGPIWDGGRRVNPLGYL